MVDLDVLAKGLPVAALDCIRRMSDGENDAAVLGATSSDSTRRLKAINRLGELVSRKYRGGRNRYSLTPLGLALRAHLKDIQDG